MKSGNDFVRSQSPKALGVGSPIAGRVGGDAPIVVEIYAIGSGVTLKRKGCNLIIREGTFELEANGEIFIFDPLFAIQAHGLVASIEGDVAPVFLSLQAVDQEYLVEFGQGIGHSGSPLKTTILALPQGYGKTSMASALADKLGCTSIVDEWNPKVPLTPGALHLTNMVLEIAEMIYRVLPRATP